MRIFGDWKKLLIGGAAATAIVAGSMTALAQTSGEPDASAPPASESGDSTDQEPDACVFEDWEPTPEERAWI